MIVDIHLKKTNGSELIIMTSSLEVKQGTLRVLLCEQI